MGTQAGHYFAVLENPDEYDWHRRRAWEWISELPAESTTARVLAIEEPRVRGSFYDVLAANGDPAQAPAIREFLSGMPDWIESYDREQYVEEACLAMGRLDPAYGPPEILKLYNNSAGDWQAAAGRAVEALGPDVMLDAVLALSAPFQRGRWHKMLVTTGDPKHIAAIFAHVEQQGRLAEITGRFSDDEGVGQRFEAEAASLVAFGEAGTPHLEAGLQSTKRANINLAAEALRQVNLPFLISHCRTKLGEYHDGVFGENGLAWAHQVHSIWEDRGQNPDAPEVTAEQNAQAEAILEDFSHRSFRILEMLKALGPVTENEDADFCFIQGLSSFSKPVAEHCAAALKQRLTPDELVDVLFQYIAKKSEFELREVEGYEQLLLETGVPGAERIGTNLERLLTDAEGDPEEVFWIYKRMAFTVLATTGQPAQIPVLAKYREDTGAFWLTGGNSVTGPTREQVNYKDLVEQTIATIKARGGR